MDIYLYSFESGGEPFGTYYTPSYRAAKTYAEKHRLAIIENVYEWQEGVLVESFEVKQTLPCLCGQCVDVDDHFECEQCERHTPRCRESSYEHGTLCDECAAQMSSLSR